MMRTSNPTLNPSILNDLSSRGFSETATVMGAVNKTTILLMICLATAWYAWTQTVGVAPSMGWGTPQSMPSPTPWVWVGALGGLVVALITIFKKTWAPFTAPIYAALEGLAIGSVSAVFEYQYPGIVLHASLGTFGTLLGLLALFRSNVIRATPRFQRAVFIGTAGVGVLYLVDMTLRTFGHSVPFIHESGGIGIAFSLFVVGLAAFNLVLDFEFFEQAEKTKAPKYMEWYAAFGLLVTLVWLYLEILRLMSKMRRR